MEKNISDKEQDIIDKFKDPIKDYPPKIGSMLFNSINDYHIFNAISQYKPKHIKLNLKSYELILWINNIVFIDPNTIEIEFYRTPDTTTLEGRLLGFAGDMLSLKDEIKKYYPKEDLYSELHARTAGELDEDILKYFFPDLLKYDQEDFEEAQLGNPCVSS